METKITETSLETGTVAQSESSETIVLKKDQIVLGKNNNITCEDFAGKFIATSFSGSLSSLGTTADSTISMLGMGGSFTADITTGSISCGTLNEGTVNITEVQTGSTVAVDSQTAGLINIGEATGGEIWISKINDGYVDIAELKKGNCDIKVNGGYLFANLVSGRVLVNSENDMSGGAIYIGQTAGGTKKTIKSGSINISTVDGEQYNTPAINIASLQTASLNIGSVNVETFNYPPYTGTSISLTNFYNGTLTISNFANGTVKANTMTGGMNIVVKQTGGIVSLQDYQKGDIYLTMNLSELKKNMEQTLIKPDGSYNNGAEPTNKFTDGNNHQYFSVNVGSTGTGDFYLIQCEIYYGGTGTVRHYLYYDSQCCTDGAQECLPLDKGPNVANNNGNNPATLHLMCRKDSSNLYFQMYYCDKHNWPTCNADGTDYTLYSSVSGNQRTCFNYLHVYKLGMVLSTK